MIGLIVIGCVGLFLFGAPLVLYGTLSIGNATGLLLSVICLLAGLFFQQLKDAVKRQWQKRIGRCVIIALIAMSAAIAGLACFETALIISAATHKVQEEGTVLVLGCLVKGTHPSISLQERIDAAYDYLSDHPEAKCILSGGQGPREAISEAQCMYEVLVDKGIDASRLYQENRSTNTRENLLFSLELIRQEGLNEHLIIITNNFHEYRANHIAGRLGLSSESYAASTHWTLLPTHYVRELYCLLYEWIR